jgi:hypothetical protein
MNLKDNINNRQLTRIWGLKIISLIDLKKIKTEKK